MALVKDGVLLTAFKQASLVGLTAGCSGANVILTQTNRRVAVYNVADQKLVHDWLSKTGLEPTCPAVELQKTSQFAVIINSQILYVWNQNDMTIDKGTKHHLPKPADRLFVVADKLLILYSDGCLGGCDRLIHEVDGNTQQQQMLWSEQATDGSIVAVFRDKSRNRCDQNFARLYRLGRNLACASISETVLQQPQKRVHPLTFCVQSVDSEDIHLITMYTNCHLSRTSLMTSENVDLPSPLFGKQTPLQGLAIVALDSVQLALVGLHSDDNQTIGIGVWDTKFGVYHSWVPLVDSRKCHGQLYYVNRRLFLSCVGGVYAFGVIPKAATLMACIGRTPVAVTQNQSGDCQVELKKLTHTLQHLSQASLTPTREAFESSFSVVSEWLAQADQDDRLRVLPLINSVVLRCVGEKVFWPSKQLTELVNAKLITPSTCTLLCKSLATHDDVHGLLTCLTRLNDIPETAMVAALSCFLSVDESKFSDISFVSSDDDSDDGMDCDDLPPVFTQRRAHCIDRLLSLPFNDVFLLEAMQHLNYAQVLDLIRHLEFLLSTRSAIGSSEDCQPTLTQVIDWLSLLIDAHYPQMALSPDTQQLHDRLQAALHQQRQDVELMSEIDEHLMFILRGQKIVEKNVGSYCIATLHVD